MQQHLLREQELSVLNDAQTTKTVPHGQVQTVYWHPKLSTAAGILLTYL